MDKPFGWAFIGTGTLARKVIPQLTAGGAHTVVSAYSRNRERLEEFCKKHGVYPARSVEDAIHMPGVDAVYISATNESHYSLAKLCLEHGKNVLLEKPFTINATEAEELFLLAKEKNVYLVEAMWTWFCEVPNQVKEIVQSGKLGKLSKVDIYYEGMSINYAPRVTDPACGGGALLDVGIYTIAFAYQLFGMPKAMKCFDYEIKNGVDLREKLELTYKDFSVAMEISIIGGKNSGAYIEGEHGFLASPVFNNGSPALLNLDGAISTLKGKSGITTEFDEAAKEMREGRKTSAFVPPESTIGSMKILDEARRQMKLVYPFEAV